MVDAAAISAKLQAEIEFLEKEKELRRLQLERDLAIANAEESAIKKILEDEKLPSDKEETSVKKEMKSELNSENIKQERSFSVNPYASPFVSSSSPVCPPKPLKVEPAIAPQSQSHEINTALQEIVNLQAKQTELSSLIIN